MKKQFKIFIMHISYDRQTFLIAVVMIRDFKNEWMEKEKKQFKK